MRWHSSPAKVGVFQRESRLCGSHPAQQRRYNATQVPWVFSFFFFPQRTIFPGLHDGEQLSLQHQWLVGFTVSSLCNCCSSFPSHDWPPAADVDFQTRGARSGASERLTLVLPYLGSTFVSFFGLKFSKFKSAQTFFKITMQSPKKHWSTARLSIESFIFPKPVWYIPLSLVL